MISVTDAITTLARKLGYEGEDPKTVADAVGCITASVDEGGSDSEGGGLIAPTFTDTGEGYSCDMTFAEVNAAVKAGKCCYAFLGMVYILSEYYEDEGVMFTNIIVDSNTGVLSTSILYEPTGITVMNNRYL